MRFIYLIIRKLHIIIQTQKTSRKYTFFSVNRQFQSTKKGRGFRVLFC